MTRSATAKRLILDLASTTGGAPLPVHLLVSIATVFGISENSLRVALARLCARGLLERNERGLYALARGGSALGRHVGSWTDFDARLVPWRGGWIGVCTPPARGRGTLARGQRRALEFVGLQALRPTLLVRPDNLIGGARSLQQRLAELGLEALVFRLDQLDEAAEALARRLWDVAELERGNRELLEELVESGVRLPELPLEEAVVECFELGGRVLRHLAYDPLLPAAIQDPAGRDALVDEMRRYDRQGRLAWQECFGIALPLSPLRSCVVHERVAFGLRSPP